MSWTGVRSAVGCLMLLGTGRTGLGARPTG